MEIVRSIWFWVFAGSSLGLAAVVLRNRHGRKAMMIAAMNVSAAFILLYLLGLAEPFIHFRLPINPVTVATAAVLGIPGLVMLAGLKLLVVV